MCIYTSRLVFLKLSERFSKMKSISRTKGPLKTNQGKMSSAHGTTGQSKSNNMNQGGKNTVGAGSRTFSSGNYRQAGLKTK